MDDRLYRIDLTDFEFPEGLPNDRANFRLTVDLRYVDRRGRFATKQVVMPGLDTFWECDTGKIDDPRFVRQAGDGDGWDHRFNMDLVDPWQRLVVIVQAQSLLALQVKVWDVDRDNWKDALAEVLGGALEAVVGRGPDLAEARVPEFLRDSVGEAGDDAKALALSLLAAGAGIEHALLFRDAIEFRVEDGQVIGRHLLVRGGFALEFHVRTIDLTE